MTALVLKLLDETLARRLGNRPFNYLIALPTTSMPLPVFSRRDVWITSSHKSGHIVHQFLSKAEIEYIDHNLVLSGDPSSSFSVEANMGVLGEIKSLVFARLANLAVEFAELDEIQSNHLREGLERKVKVRSSNSKFIERVMAGFPEEQKNVLLSDPLILSAYLRKTLFLHELETEGTAQGHADPFQSIVNQILAALKPSVRNRDLDFQVSTTITPLNSQTFDSRSYSDPASSEISMAKTQIAEYRHQELLREVSRAIAGLGYSLGETRSADLIATSNEKSTVFEVKSVTDESVKSQFDSGVMQLLKYREAFAADEVEVDLCLVLGMCAFERKIGSIPHRVLDRVRIQLVCWCYCHRESSVLALRASLLSGENP